jgi:hypothetical protein
LLQFAIKWIIKYSNFLDIPNGNKKKGRNMEKDMKRIPAIAAVVLAMALLAGSVFFQADAQEYTTQEEPAEAVETVAEEGAPEHAHRAPLPGGDRGLRRGDRHRGGRV